MFHNVRNVHKMPWSTPDRRGLFVDTKHTAFAYATPPQSAHESHRPSLQFSTTASTFSQPSTPNDLSQRTEDFLHGWADGSGASARNEADIVGSFSSGYGSDTGSHPLIRRHSGIATPASHDFSSYSYSEHVDAAAEYGLHSIMASPTDEAWPQLRSSFGPALAVSHNFSSQTSSSMTAPNFSITLPFHSHNTGLDSHASISHSSLYGPSIGANYHPQVVVPSQLTPGDHYATNDFDEYTSLRHSSDDLSCSFASSGHLDEGFEPLAPPSPMEAYFENSNEDDAFVVKMDDSFLADHNLEMHRSATASETRKKRSVKSSRNERQRAWHMHRTGNIEVRCEGHQFCLDQPIKTETARSKRPFACTHVKENGIPCAFRCSRAEHLKRHMLMHSDERAFHCPVSLCPKNPDCPKDPKCPEKERKGISRSDNATDHFKTHLRPRVKGKRNQQVEWNELIALLLETYEPRRGAKIITNLTRWRDAGMPEPAASRRKSC